MVRSSTQPSPVYYPEEDDQLMETTQHAKQYAYLMYVLDAFFKDRPDVHVGGNNFVYYQQGDRTKFLGPDIFVAFGVRPRTNRERGSYKIWEEGVPPTVIIELTSESTLQVDTVEKPVKYAQWGVQEYYLFDPLGDLLNPPLQGYHLNAAGQFEPLPGSEFPSPALGLRLLVRDGWLRLFDPATGTFLPTPEEFQEELERKDRQILAAQTATEQEHEALIAAEAEIARLRDLLARLQDSSSA